jgi:hypothetical protein
MLLTCSRRTSFDKRFEDAFDPYKPCSGGGTENTECRIIDMNMICSQEKKCACRQDMKWNKETAECQIFMVRGRLHSRFLRPFLRP